VASFPDLGGNAPFMHPSTRTKRYVTDVNKFGDGSEQRNQSASAALVDWDMQFVDIAPHELELVRQFFIDQKGMDGVLFKHDLHGRHIRGTRERSGSVRVHATGAAVVGLVSLGFKATEDSWQNGSRLQRLSTHCSRSQDRRV
jgi:hypothetical protein